MADPTSILDHDDDLLLQELRRWSNARDRAQASLRSEDLRDTLAPIPQPSAQRIERLRALIPDAPAPAPWWSRVFGGNANRRVGMGHYVQVSCLGLGVGALAFWLLADRDVQSPLLNDDWSIEIDSPRAIAGTEASTSCEGITPGEPFTIAFRPQKAGVGTHDVWLFEASDGELRPLLGGKIFHTDDPDPPSVHPETDLSRGVTKWTLVALIGTPGADCDEPGSCVRVEWCAEQRPMGDGSG